MESKTNLQVPPKATKVRIGGISIHLIIGLVIMFGVGFLPAPAPITPVGMKVIGLFIGVVYLWSTVAMDWPSLLAIAASSFYIHLLIPESPTAHYGPWRAVQESLGNWVVGFIIGALLLTHALTQAGFTRRVALWFMTRKFSQRGPWSFTCAFFLAILVIGCFIDAAPAIIFALAIAYVIFERLGYQKGDKYPIMVVIGLAFIVNIAFGMTPISHPVPLIGMSVFTSITGAQISFFEYMAVCVPVGLIIFVLLMLFFRFIVKPDVSKFKDIDYNELLGEMPGPMNLREKLTVLIYFLVVIFWLAPGFFSIVNPNAAIAHYLDQITILMPTYIGVIIMLILKVDGKPLLDFEDCFKTVVPYKVLALIACAMLFGTLLTQEATGLNDFIIGKIMPIIEQGYSPFIIVSALLIIIIIAANLLNHAPVTVLFVAVFTPIAMQMSIEPKIMGILATFAGQLGFMLPPVLVTVALVYGDKYSKPSKVLLYGAVTMVICMIAITLVGYPLAKGILG